MTADRHINVPLVELWPDAAWPAALAAAGVHPQREIRVWCAKPEKARKQTKIHVHVEDLEPFLRMLFVEKRAHGVHEHSPAHGSKWAASTEWFDCVTCTWHIKVADEVRHKAVPARHADGSVVTPEEYASVKLRTLQQLRAEIQGEIAKAAPSDLCAGGEL